MPTTPAVGKDVDSWCTKCRMMLAHTVEAVANGRITKVHCNTCNGQHAYRAKPPGETKAGARKRADGARLAAKPAQDYNSLLRSRDPATARPYALTERFASGELIKHSTFGLGVVTGIREQNKIEVMFPDGGKTLIHRR